MVERLGFDVQSEVGEVPIETFVIRAHNDTAKGIAADELDTGGDQIDIPRRVGESAATFSIVRLIDDSNGFVRVMVQ